MLKYIQQNNLTMPVPVYKQEKARVLEKVRALLMRRGTEPTARAIAEFMEWPLREVEELQAMPSRQEYSRDGAADIEGPSEALAGVWQANGATPLPDERLRAEQQAEEIKKWVQKVLTVREYLVLNLRYGLDAGEAKTLQETGDALHLTKERIRQIEGNALEKLRAFFKFACTYIDTTELVFEGLSRLREHPFLLESSLSFKLVKPPAAMPLVLDNSFSFKLVRPAKQARSARKKMKKILEEGARAKIKKLLQTLTEAEQRVIELRFGIAGEPAKTLRETALLLGKHVLYIWKAEGKALEKLYKILKI